MGQWRGSLTGFRLKQVREWPVEKYRVPCRIPMPAPIKAEWRNETQAGFKADLTLNGHLQVSIPASALNNTKVNNTNRKEYYEQRITARAGKKRQADSY